MNLTSWNTPTASVASNHPWEAKSLPFSCYNIEMLPVQTTQPPTPKNIWQQLQKPFLILAPMEGVTNPVYRQVIAAPADHNFFHWIHQCFKFRLTMVTPMLSPASLSPHWPPIIAQIWGKNPHISPLPPANQKLGFAGIDLSLVAPTAMSSVPVVAPLWLNPRPCHWLH